MSDNILSLTHAHLQITPVLRRVKLTRMSHVIFHTVKQQVGVNLLAKHSVR